MTPPTPAKPRLSPVMIALLVTACVAVGFVGLIALKVLASGRGGTQPQEIFVQSCGTSDAGNLQAEVRIENHTRTDRSYIVTVEFTAGDERLGEGRIVVNDLHPGQSAVERAIVLRKPTGQFRCEVNTQRF